MGEQIVFTSGKGGVGKTTTVANVGVALARLDYNVVVVDTDTGLRNLDLLLGLENRIVYDLIDVAKENCKLEQALIKDRKNNLHFLATSQIADKNSITQEEIIKIYQHLKNKFDYVLVDSPAGIEQGFKNAITGCDRAVIVTNPEISSIRDSDRVIGLLESENIAKIQLVLNRVNYNLIEQGQSLDIEDVIDILNIEKIGIIPESEKIIIATNKGEPIANKEDSRLSQRYLNIANRITGNKVEFIPLEKEAKGWFKRLFFN